jgi:hypothetical protein
MATQDDVRRIAMQFPGVQAAEDGFAFSVPNRKTRNGFVWAWMERIDPKKSKVPSREVIAVSVRNLTEKELLLASDPVKFFTEPHYNGFPAVLVRLGAIAADELEDVLLEAWKCKAAALQIEEFEKS